MVWLLIIALILVSLLAGLAVLVLAASLAEDSESEQARIELEVMRAERRLHDLARASFKAMFDEARAHNGKG